MRNTTYIIATVKSWNINAYREIIANYPGHWSLIDNPKDLTEELIRKRNPRYLFFPHWSHRVPANILNLVECVGFHETDLPYGRGGSPIQNLIARGHAETMISAVRMTEEIDAGPVYLKHRLSLEGLAEEIFIRTSKIIAKMILEIVKKEPVPKEQEGEATAFKRRTPEQSKISGELKQLNELYDHIRMLDASGYPRAFIRLGCFKFEIARPALRSNAIEADIRITRISEEGEDKK